MLVQWVCYFGCNFLFRYYCLLFALRVGWLGHVVTFWVCDWFGACGRFLLDLADWMPYTFGVVWWLTCVWVNDLGFGAVCFPLLRGLDLLWVLLFDLLICYFV